MGERLEILEFKRRLNTNKDKFKNQLQYVCDLFSVDGEEYLKRYGYLSEEMVKTFVQMEELKHKLNDLDYKCEKLKSDIIVENNIDIKERIKDMMGRERILMNYIKVDF
jgi:nicotinic acid phosphoribosyltransferase